MSFGDYEHPVARKRHRCEWCYWPIPVGEKHVQFKGQWEGEWQNWRMHSECHAEADSGDFTLIDGFSPGEGEPPDRIRELVNAEKAKQEPKP